MRAVKLAIKTRMPRSTRAEPARTKRLYRDLTESPFGDWYEPVEGYLVLPHGPGLGIEPDHGILDKLRVD